MIERTASEFAIAYDRAGSGVPLLLIHGWPHSRALWAGQMSGLATQALCIAPDIRGFGESTVRGPWTIDQFADDLDALLGALAIPTVIVCGLSMGGYVALSLWRRHPERVRGLILSSTRATADSPEAREKRVRLIEFIERKGMAALANRQLAAMVGATTLESRPDVRVSLLELMAAAPPAGVIGALRAMADRADSSDLLPTITVPTLVVGGAEDTFIPPDELRAMAAGIPNSRFELLAGSGHVCAYERPAAFNHVVGEFLRDV